MNRLIGIFSFIVLITACKNDAKEPQASPEVKVNESAAAPVSTSTTTIQWIDSVRDMGKVTEGQKVEVSFRFRNSGSKPLIIQQVNPSCGCTVADAPKEPIAPGSEGVIKGVFDSNGKPGMNTKTMTVLANTEGTNTHQLSFTVNVQKKSS